ncbi:ABC transporter permease [Prescottella defluvii]|nr:ABC transporter permease [Prescottella defluvii]
MIWVTWRQYRTTILAAVGGILALTVVAVVSGEIVRGSEGRRAFGTFFGCVPGGGSNQCWAESSLTAISTLAAILPVVLGAFVGVTVFSRDIERGTHVLGLTQSVSRTRWYWSRVLVVFVPVTIAGVMLGSVLEVDTFGEYRESALRIRPQQLRRLFTPDVPLFQSTGIVVGAYTLLALILGSAIALLLRNTLGSMVVTLIAMAALMVGFQFEVRPQYTTPVVESQPLGYLSHAVVYTPDIEPVWILNSGYVDADGRSVDMDYFACDQEGVENTWEQRPDETFAEYEARQDVISAEQEREFIACQRAQGIDHFETRYHPDSLLRRFQLTEAALALALSALLLIPSLWALRRLRP